MLISWSDQCSTEEAHQEASVDDNAHVHKNLIQVCLDVICIVSELCFVVVKVAAVVVVMA